MANLLVRCSKTAMSVPTGIAKDYRRPIEVGLEKFIRVKCPYCGDTHKVAVSDAFDSDPLVRFLPASLAISVNEKGCPTGAAHAYSPNPSSAKSDTELRKACAPQPKSWIPVALARARSLLQIQRTLDPGSSPRQHS